MNTNRSLWASLGIGCLVVGVIAAMSGGGTVSQVMALGHTLVIAGAILIAGVIISSAIVASESKK